MSGQVAIDDFADALGAEGEFPVPAHHVDAEPLARVDHVLAAGPQRRGRTLPGIAAVEQQGAGAPGAQPFDQRRQVGEAADAAIAAGGGGEVERGEGVGLGGSGADAEGLEQVLADEVRRLAGGRADADVHRRFAEPDGQQLGVAVGEMEQVHVAETRQIVDGIAAARGGEQARRIEGESGRRGGGEDMEKFAAIHGLQAAKLTG